MNKEELDQNMCKDGSSAEKVDAVEVQTLHRRTPKGSFALPAVPKFMVFFAVVFIGC